MAVSVLRDLVMVFVSGSHYARLYNVKRGCFVLATPEMERALSGLRLPWACYMAAFCVGADGECYLADDYQEAAEPVTREEVAGAFSDEMRTLLDGRNQAHLRGYGWIASPAGAEVDRETARQVFETMDAWRVRSAEEEMIDYLVA